MTQRKNLHKRSAHRETAESLISASGRKLITETLESILEVTVPNGDEISRDLRDEELSDFKRSNEMACLIAEHHADTVSGAYALTLFTQVMMSQFQLALALLSARFPAANENDPIVVVFAALGFFLSGYICSILASIAVTDRKTKAGTAFVVMMSLGNFVHSPQMYTHLLFLEMYSGLIVGILAGAPTVRTCRKLFVRG